MVILVERIDPVTLLFQAGYLTIDHARQIFDQWLFSLRVPNQEVRQALANHLVDAYTSRLPSERLRWQKTLYDSLAQGDVAGLLAAISRLFAGIPWRNFTANDLPLTEGYYASVLYAFFASLNAEIIPEDISNQGQVDLTIKLVDYIYVIEIKLNRGQAGPVPSGIEPRPGDATVPVLTQAGDNPALVQIQARGYSAKYRGLPNKGLFEVGLVFDPQAGNLTQADWVAVV